MAIVYRDRISRAAVLELVAFFVLTFAATWTICGAYLLAPEAMTARFGAMKTGSPIFFAAVYAPSVCGVVLTLVRQGGGGLLQLAAAAVRIAGKWWWVLLSIVGYPLLWLVVAMVEQVAGGRSLAAVPYSNWYAALPLVVLSGFVFKDAGPLGEEFGWRGFALPRLLDMMDARAAALLLGAIWAVWHLPAFFLAGLSQSKFVFGIFFFEVIGFSVLMTLFFLHTRGSLLLAGIVQHMWFNAVSKAGIHTIHWLTIAVAVALLVLGGRLWRNDQPSAIQQSLQDHHA
jgi:membrane protease YdiL (CAAX protease family)